MRKVNDLIKNNKIKNIITIVLLIMLVVGYLQILKKFGAGLMMWEARNW